MHHKAIKQTHCLY